MTLLMLMPIYVQDERGIALLLTLMATVLLTALGGALITLTTAETAIASNYRNAVEAFYAAEAGVEYVVQELGTMPSWSPILTGAVRSSFAGGSQRPTRLDGSPLDLGEETASLQSESDAVARGGPNRRIWRLYAYGPITALLPMGAIGTPTFVAVWVADDLSETDGDALIDGNETLTLHARAYGPSNSRKIVEATVARNSLPGEARAEDLPSRETRSGGRASVGHPGLRVLSWREIR